MQTVPAAEGDGEDLRAAHRVAGRDQKVRPRDA